MEQWPQFFYTQESAFMNKPGLFIYRKMKEDDKVSRAKNPKYESMSLEELKANMEKSRQEQWYVRNSRSGHNNVHKAGTFHYPFPIK